MSTQWDKEYGQLGDMHNEGIIDTDEYYKRLREMERAERDEMLGAAEEAAQQAYNDVLNHW